MSAQQASFGHFALLRSRNYLSVDIRVGASAQGCCERHGSFHKDRLWYCDRVDHRGDCVFGGYPDRLQALSEYSAVGSFGANRVSALRVADRTSNQEPILIFGSAPVARYYYFWYVLCSYPARLTHIDPRCVLYGSSVWSGFLLAALIPIYLRDFLGVTENLRRKAVIGLTLIAVTGLDILPTIYEFFRAHRITADMEWWIQCRLHRGQTR